jgi:hypothetical protein
VGEKKTPIKGDEDNGQQFIQEGSDRAV